MSLPVTEDTPPDMLAGSMDLKVVLPDGQTVRMSVQRGTPMMDLLVQVTTAHCLTPGDYSLQPMGDRGVLPFKPSTPIGALDTFTVKIVEKKLGPHGRGRAAQVPQNFLNTFRLQVHLPRSQLFVLRVTPDVTLSEIMTHICTEKNLNMEKYEFRNPGNLDEVLRLDKTLGDYKLQALSMMSKGNRTVTGLMSSADMINVKSSKQRQNSVCDSSLSSGSFGSRSGSPIPPINVVTMPPQPPMRKKRRPAPKPPTFNEKEKKDQTTDSVLISHSRESSDSSGYHEASVLSESPIHGSPAGRIDSDSPPDTLPRRAKLPPSQSFTNLTTIQPPPKNRLTSSVSNTSLNSNGFSRKKRAPPPPPPKDTKVKSSTLPTSVTEERRNATSLRHLPGESPVEVPHAKVQSPVETKASEEVAACVDVDVRLPPKPRPRTSVPKTPERAVDSEGPKLNRWKNLENLAEEEDAKDTSQRKDATKKDATAGDGSGKSSGLIAESSEDPLPDETPDNADHDSINWEYQLPPPPTDFRDSSSPTCTEFGTVTITPEVLENVGKTDPGPAESRERTERLPERTERLPDYIERPPDCLPDKKFSQNKSAVMSEVTNILNGKQRFKEKSLSVSNLYIHEAAPKDWRKNGLSYSRSFSTEVSPSHGNNRTLSASNEVIRDGDDIAYRNNRNLEKSSSMECIRPQRKEDCRIIDRTTEDVFRKPVAPVQKKLKVAKRSVSSVGAAAQKRTSLDVDPSHCWEDDENINILREQFLEFLKEKKLSRDLNAKSLDVIRNILPDLSQVDKDAKDPQLNLVINQSTADSSQEVKDRRTQEMKDLRTQDMKDQRVQVVKDQRTHEVRDLRTQEVDRRLQEVRDQRTQEVDRRVQEVKDQRTQEVDRRVQEVRDQRTQEMKDLRTQEVKDLRTQEVKDQMVQDVRDRRTQEEDAKKRYSYQGPPSINFGTWGDRPKITKIIIKDEDYVTRDKVTQKSEQAVRADVAPKPKEVPKRPGPIVLKKPGVLSRYEMFSALPRRKEVSSRELVQMEDEERKKRTAAPWEASRVPVVCGMELKKEAKAAVKMAEEPEVKGRHSVSVYVNGGPEVERTVGRRNSGLMPVVKGFRCLGEGKEGVGVGGGRGEEERKGVVVRVKGLGSGSGSWVGRKEEVSSDPRGDLMAEIRNFGGLRKLKRAAVH